MINYSSVEEAVSNIGYDILYPSYLPDGVKIERVVFTDMGNGTIQIVFSTNFENLWIDITNPTVTPEHLKTFNLYNNGEIDFYILEKSSLYQVFAWHENMEYNIMNNNYDELINILNGIKEIEK